MNLFKQLQSRTARAVIGGTAGAATGLIINMLRENGPLSRTSLAARCVAAGLLAYGLYILLTVAYRFLQQSGRKAK